MTVPQGTCTGALLDWVKQENEADPSGTTLIIEYIDECLMSIYQPCDISANKHHKQKIRSESYGHIACLESKPGEQIKISCEALVRLIENAYDTINKV